MRITGGEAKGRKLTTLRGLTIRPSSEKVREAIFNLIGQDMSNMNVLDLFAGSGIQGIEALSRGALFALFIDNSNRSINLIQKNLKLCSYESRSSILKRDLSKGFPANNTMLKKRYDLIFIDPPYGKDLVEIQLIEILRKKIFNRSLKIVVESSIKDYIPEKVGTLHVLKQKIYGQTKITIFNN